MKLQDAEQRLVFKCIAGSHAYGTNTLESDTDFRGVFTVSSDQYFRLNKPPEQVSDEKNDTTYYTVLRFLELATAGNPNILELLWTPEDCVIKTSESWERIKAIRSTFVTKSVLNSFGGYAVAQIKKVKGQNKLVNNPIPEEKPKKEDFCWVIPFHNNSGGCESWMEVKGLIGQKLTEGQFPCRPVPLKESSSNQWGTPILLHKANASRMEHTNNVYRLYYFGDLAKGVFRGDVESADIVCEPISISEEYASFMGLLIYNKDAYEKALRDWTNYWGWRKNRNEARWRDQENKTVQYDQKNMMHCLRLLYSAENILENGEPIVRFSGEKLQRLRDIRAGKILYEEILTEAEGRLAILDAARETCSLPSKVDMELVSELSIKLHRI